MKIESLFRTEYTKLQRLLKVRKAIANVRIGKGATYLELTSGTSDAAFDLLHIVNYLATEFGALKCFRIIRKLCSDLIEQCLGTQDLQPLRFKAVSDLSKTVRAKCPQKAHAPSVGSFAVGHTSNNRVLEKEYPRIFTSIRELSSCCTFTQTVSLKTGAHFGKTGFPYLFALCISLRGTDCQVKPHPSPTLIPIQPFKELVSSFLRRRWFITLIFARDITCPGIRRCKLTLLSSRRSKQ